MTYITGSLAAVPTAKKDEYEKHVKAAWPLFKSYGAIRMIETWGVDVPKGKITDFYEAVSATELETIVFAWIEWPDKTTADASWQKMQDDPAMAELPEMPFDGSRMIFGGFMPIYEEGIHNDVGYYQGFLLAVPTRNKTPYIEAAKEGWDMFEKLGAMGIIECWGEDVPRGQKTDFYRATKAEADEMPVFSWICWPDRATCDAASKMMEAEMDNTDMNKMPFDGMRMMWAGFEPLFDSTTTA